jgi:hypothetical protein
MTKYRWQNPEAAVSKPKVEDPSDAFYNEVVKVIEGLVKDDLLVDSGQKRWSERTGRYEIVWVLTELGERIGKIEAPSTLEQHSRPRRLN